uniref:Magnesium-dependent phosphatase 1 n=1 Tax=Clastoptera arizonana TaxID=38151 RepID=A0A1B6DN34_9HEMI
MSLNLQNFNKLPSLIVFDLDYTLWPYWVDTHVDFPVSKKYDGKVYDRRGHNIKLYPEVLEVLELLSSSGMNLGIASRTGEISGANDLLRLFDIKKYFKYREIYPGNKTSHFSRFQSLSNIKYEDMLFFDDEMRNIHDISRLGVTCILVENGTSMSVLKEGLTNFCTNKKK